MKRRPVLRGILATLLLLICGTGLYLYSWVHGARSAMQAVELEGAPAGGDSVKSHDSLAMPAEFARQFAAQYMVDTVSGHPGALIVDTSYRAIPRTSALGGRKVSISVCGVDSRLNDRVEHADANHVITVWLDSGIVDIVSIPRDTPCDAGFGKGNRLNMLANLRARKGREAYLREVTAIAGLDTIEYYVDLGFSQARGVLELLGFRQNADDALRILRSRQAFASGDFQRSFNQGQFMRQMLLANLERMSGLDGEIAMRAGLFIVNTNLTLDTLKGIVGCLAKHNLAASPAHITVSVKPEYYAKMAVFNFRDPQAMGALLNRINAKAAQLGIAGNNGDSVMAGFRRSIGQLLARAAQDTEKVPVRAVASLRRCFQQRVWWQISDLTERSRVRRQLGTVLAAAYQRSGHADEAQRVREVVRFEEEMSAAGGSSSPGGSAANGNAATVPATHAWVPRAESSGSVRRP
ncbi:MAG TPA: hypothetical protein VHI13_20050 [Candidatus Kapabacteria bacterium]|nr:hypothetical protein [Candidatus Kapabacteria bacterium]